jgi:hypothetical protein
VLTISKRLVLWSQLTLLGLDLVSMDRGMLRVLGLVPALRLRHFNGSDLNWGFDFGLLVVLDVLVSSADGLSFSKWIGLWTA